MKTTKAKSCFNHHEFWSICPGCAQHFSKVEIRGIYKDVVECLNCGEIFITDDYNIEKYGIDLFYYCSYDEGVTS